MARARTQKAIAKRVDFSYLDQPQPMRRARFLLSLLACAVAVAWVALMSLRVQGGRIRTFDPIHNPGPVSAAHAIIQNDCGLCHTGTGSANGRHFSKAVTDAACLKCHDGAIHHPNQKRASTTQQVSRTTLVLAIDDRSHPVFPARSADCVTCHVEHRGKTALAATSDAHCTVCHANLPAATSSGSSQIKSSILAFNTSDHPHFGGPLRDASGEMKDPTVLRFRHQKHFDAQPILKSCFLCHSTEDQSRIAHAPKFENNDPPPYTTQKDRTDIRVVAGARTGAVHMRPVSFERHCISCHIQSFDLPQVAGVVSVAADKKKPVEFKLSDPVAPTTLPHEDLSIVRRYIESQVRAATGKPDQNFTKSSARPAATTQSSRQEWLVGTLQRLTKGINDELAEEDYPDVTHKGQQVTSAESATETAVVNFYTAYAALNKNGCAMCHDLNGDLPAVQDEELRLSTKPTGIGTTPRRWFAASRFNHDAHRDLSCKSCHFKAWTSSETSDVLSPDIDSKIKGGQSCVDCHRPSTWSMPAAPADCVTCHNFHDRTKERPLVSAAR